MSDKTRIPIPGYATLRDSTTFAARLDLLPGMDEVVFDAIALQHVPPFGMLFTSAAIRQFISNRRKARPHFSVVWENYDLNDFASHMGYWKSAGLDYGKFPGEAQGASHYLPITALDTQDIRRRAKSAGMHHSFLLDRDAKPLSEVLCQDAGQGLAKTVAYSLRELFRNAVEHSTATTIWYCAQYWPAKNLVELAILDEGIGIRQSLAENPIHKHTHELHALRASIRRGVTRYVPRPTDISDMSAWDTQSYGLDPHFVENSGWGLYVISEIARRTGTFVLISNNVGVILEGKKETLLGTTFSGTAIRILLRPNRLGTLLDDLLSKSGRNRASKFGPSLFASLE